MKYAAVCKCTVIRRMSCVLHGATHLNLRRWGRWQCCPHLLLKKLGHGDKRGFHAVGECMVVRMVAACVQRRRGEGTRSVEPRVELSVARTLRLRPPRAHTARTVLSPPSDTQPNHQCGVGVLHTLPRARSHVHVRETSAESDLEWMCRDGGQLPKCELVRWSGSEYGITPGRGRWRGTSRGLTFSRAGVYACPHDCTRTAVQVNRAADRTRHCASPNTQHCELPPRGSLSAKGWAEHLRRGRAVAARGLCMNAQPRRRHTSQQQRHPASHAHLALRRFGVGSEVRQTSIKREHSARSMVLIIDGEVVPGASPPSAYPQSSEAAHVVVPGSNRLTHPAARQFRLRRARPTRDGETEAVTADGRWQSTSVRWPLNPCRLLAGKKPVVTAWVGRRYSATTDNVHHPHQQLHVVVLPCSECT
jgi:hypothetical protein